VEAGPKRARLTADPGEIGDGGNEVSLSAPEWAEGVVIAGSMKRQARRGGNRDLVVFELNNK